MKLITKIRERDWVYYCPELDQLRIRRAIEGQWLCVSETIDPNNWPNRPLKYYRYEIIGEFD